jgi:hypothetical protein
MGHVSKVGPNMHLAIQTQQVRSKNLPRPECMRWLEFKLTGHLATPRRHGTVYWFRILFEKNSKQIHEDKKMCSISNHLISNFEFGSK